MDLCTTSLLVGQVVSPGDAVLRVPESGEVRIGGSGLQLADGHVMCTKQGVLRQTRAGKVWLEGRQKRYIPSQEDVVIGVILDRHAESFQVDIGAPFTAQLPQLSFEGATKRNRPDLRAGDVVYARVVEAHRDMDPQLSCVDAMGRSSGFGQLKGGLLLGGNTAMARALLARPLCPVLEALGKVLQFELAVGLNGKVWVDSPSPEATIKVHRAILESEGKSAAQTEALVAQLAAQT